MNKLWVFGDSYSTYNRERHSEGIRLSIYSDVANYLNLEEINNAISGISSHDIFGNVLKFLPEYKAGDIVIFQMSFLNRVSYLDKLQYRKLNDHEKQLFLKGKSLFLHPQFYHSTKRKLDDFEIEKLSNFMRDIDDNMLDYYFKFLIFVKHIITFLNKIEVDVRIILLEDKNLKYDSSTTMQVLDIINDLELEDKLIKFGNKPDLKGVPYYKEEGEYEYHHFSLDTIQKYSDDIKQNFNERKI